MGGTEPSQFGSIPSAQLSEETSDSLLPLLQRLATPPERTVLQAGSFVGRYRIVSLLGKGGMAEVYRAHDVRLDRDVAVKVLRSGGRADSELQRRFETEAKVVGSLNHPNLLALFDAGEHNGYPYLVTELLEGETLARRLSGGPLDVRSAVETAIAIARALEAAHALEIVHRDLKPSNIFITADQRIKVLDFGLAKWTRPELLSRDTTASGVLLGTAGYMSPEQVRSEPVDARSDIFSLGAVLYEMLCGRRAFRGASPFEDLHQILHQEPPRIDTSRPNIPPELQNLVLRCLSKRPRDRFQSAHELVDALAATEGIASAAQSRIRGVGRWIARIGALLMALGVVALLGRGVVGRILERRTPGADRSSIAVLPFADMSPQKDQEYFADGISEEILNSLAQMESLHVAGRTSSFSFKGKADDARTIGQKLNVANVLEGSVRKEGTHVRITAQLVNAADGFHIWSQSYDRELTGMFAAQEEIARAVVDALKLRLVPARRRHEPAPEAYNEYLIGNQFFYRQNYQDYARAKVAYERAVKLDPDYAEAWAALAKASYFVTDYAESVAAISKGLDEAMSYAEKSLALDPDLADGYAVRGFMRSAISHDWEGSRADLARSLKLNPSAAEAHRLYASLLAQIGRLPEALAEALKATEIDPLSALSWSTLGWLSAESGQLETARIALEKSLHILPEQISAPGYLGRLYLLQKKPAEALEAAERCGSEAIKLSLKAAALHDLGRTAEAQRVLDEVIARYGHTGAFQIAEAYAWFGQTDKALEWLDRAYVQRDVSLRVLKTSMMLRGLRSDPRYRALLAKLNLPPD